MNERPILFSGERVRAILSGVMTQTRRVCKATNQNQTDIMAAAIMDDMMGADDGTHELAAWEQMRCPYGEPGDRLWVRETHFEARKWRHAPLFAAAPDFMYRADYEYREELRSVIGCHHWMPSIFMKREASRITLEIVSVRVERLQNISEADALAEGIKPVQMPTGEVMYDDYLERGAMVARPVSSYASLWASINGPGSWGANPFVWVVEFKRL
jgi:hypothetical protein